MKILITGNLGYIGPVVAGHLRLWQPDAELIGFDSAYFAHCLTGCDVLPERVLDRQVYGDIRAFPYELLNGVDAIVHLAAVSNDPMGVQFEEVTAQINHQATIALAREAAARGVRRFIFASSCSMYGNGGEGAKKEGDELNPLTAYARSKAAVERDLAVLEGDMVTTALRFSTACGASPRLRLDLVLNDFVACAIATGKITVLSDGTPWRPLIDVRDMALAIEWGIVRAIEGARFLAVNVGSDEWNYQVRDLAQAVVRKIPGAELSINHNAQPDKRSYRVDFSLYRSLAPQHQPRIKLEQVIDELAALLQGMNFADADFRASDFMRLKVLQKHIKADRLNADLYWKPFA